jgi:hypothetical protein
MIKKINWNIPKNISKVAFPQIVRFAHINVGATIYPSIPRF